MSPEPTGYGCLICGNFVFDDRNSVQECWLQFKINSQYAQLDGWIDKDLPISKTWALIEEPVAPWPRLFMEFSGCV